MMNKKLKKVIIGLAISAMILSAPEISNPHDDVSTVEAASSSSFYISDPKATIAKGGTLTLTTTWTGSGKVKWSTSNKKVATVSPTGSKDKNCKVKGVKKGTATITAKVGGKSVSCKVTVKEAAFSIDEINLKVKESSPLEFSNGSGNEKWSVSNEKIASITKKSKNKYTVTGKKAGSTNVIVKDGGKTYKCNITVVKPLKTVKNEKSVAMDFGKTATIKLKNSSNLKIKWSVVSGSSLTIESSNNTSIRFTGTALGKTKISAFCQDLNEEYIWTVNVKQVSNPGFTVSVATLNPGSQMQVPIIGVKYAQYNKYMSTDESIFSVNSNGVMTGKSLGSAFLVATIDGVSITLPVNVVSPAIIEDTTPVEPQVIQPETEQPKTEAPAVTPDPVIPQTEPAVQPETPSETIPPTESETTPQTESEVVKPDVPVESETDSETESEKVSESEEETETPVESESTPSGDDFEFSDELTDEEVEDMYPGDYTYELENIRDMSMAGGQTWGILVYTEAPESYVTFVSRNGLLQIEDPISADGMVCAYVHGWSKGEDIVDVYAEGIKKIGEVKITITSDDPTYQDYLNWIEPIKKETGFYDSSISEFQKLINCGNYILKNYKYGIGTDRGFMDKGKGNCFDAACMLVDYARMLRDLEGSQIGTIRVSSVPNRNFPDSHVVAGVQINGVIYGFDATPESYGKTCVYILDNFA